MSIVSSSFIWWKTFNTYASGRGIFSFCFSKDFFFFFFLSKEARDKEIEKERKVLYLLKYLYIANLLSKSKTGCLNWDVSYSVLKWMHLSYWPPLLMQGTKFSIFYDITNPQRLVEKSHCLLWIVDQVLSR